MKTIAAAAMTAIEAGEALVAGGVEIVPVGGSTSVASTPQTVDLSAITNTTGDMATAAATGITLTGFDLSDVLTLSMPPGGTYVASFNDHYFMSFSSGFRVMKDLDPADFYEWDSGPFSTAAAARAAFPGATLTGASTYTFIIWDGNPSDNSGGVSIELVKTGSGGGGDAIRVWGGFQPISFLADAGIRQFQPVGARGLVQQGAGAIGGVAQGLVLSLSELEPALLELLDDAQEYKNASVVIYQMIFGDGGKTLLDSPIFDRGRIDTIGADRVVGGAAGIAAAMESAARGLGRAGARMRSDADQRLIQANDGYFKHTAYAGLKKLYWGGKKPQTAGSALSGGGNGGTGLIGLRVSSR